MVNNHSHNNNSNTWMEVNMQSITLKRRFGGQQTSNW